MIVSGCGHGYAQQIAVVVNCFHDSGQEQEEAEVFGRLPVRIQEVDSRVRGKGPVVVFSASVDPLKRFFVEQAHKAVPLCHTLHDLHGELVCVNREVGGAVDRGELVLGRSHLIMAGFSRNPELPQLFVELLHKGRHAGAQGAEIVIVHFLSLGRGRAEQGPSAEAQIRSLEEKLFIDEKIFLLRAYGGKNAGDILIAEQAQDAQGLPVNRLHGAQKRRFLVERLAAVGAEGGGDAERAVLDKGRGSGIPGGVASGLKGGAQAAGGKAGGVRLALYKLFAGKVHDDLASSDRVNKAVMFFRRDPGHGLKPVREMSGPVFHGPLLHGDRHGIGYVELQMAPGVDGLAERLVDVARQPALHRPVVKDKASVQFRDILFHNHVSFQIRRNGSDHRNGYNRTTTAGKTKAEI